MGVALPGPVGSSCQGFEGLPEEMTDRLKSIRTAVVGLIPSFGINPLKCALQQKT
jgi:hypothetical protein